MGNVTGIHRYSFDPYQEVYVGNPFLRRTYSPYECDYIQFDYNGNQLLSAIDYHSSQSYYSIKEYHDRNTSGNDFAYDANGNMTQDLDRKIVTIKYNMLNLPELVQFADGHQIVNRYAADGRKLGSEFYTQVTALAAPLTAGQTIQQTYSANVTEQYGTAYCGNFEYTTEHGDEALTTLDKIYNPEGYVKDGQWYYYRRDHLGNNREVWCASTNSTVQRTQYYPSGLPMASNTGDNPSTQNRKYNGKEFVEMHGFDEYDYGARGMFPAIMRFSQVDPLAEKYYSVSPYAYCLNNPVIHIDPDGKQTNRYYTNLRREMIEEMQAKMYADEQGRDMLDRAQDFITSDYSSDYSDFSKCYAGKGGGGGSESSKKGLPTIDGVTTAWSPEKIMENAEKVISNPVVQTLINVADDLKYTKGIGNVFTALSVSSDLYQYRSSNIDKMTFSYRVTTTGLAYIAGYAFKYAGYTEAGFIPGLVIGAYASAIETGARKGAEFEVQLNNYTSPKNKNGFWSKIYGF